MPTCRRRASGAARAAALGAGVILALCACASRAPARERPGSRRPAPGAPASGLPGPGPPAASRGTVEWPTYHGDVGRSGFAAGGPDGRRPPTVAWRAHVEGAVYATPVAGAGVVIVATETNGVTALDAATGARRWSRTLGDPVQASSLACGNISPSGITGTPVVDTAAGVVHVVAFVAPAHHVLTTLDLMTGAIRTETPIDPPGLPPASEQQRAALTLANGRVYVAFGGLYGDCGPYKGAVVSASTEALDTGGPVGLEAWVTTAAIRAGVWAPAGPTVGADGSLWVATGNGGAAPGQAFDGGDAVVHLSADLRQLDSFAPSDWLGQSRADADLGSSSPVLLGSRVLQVGKTGDAYLLDATRLGGVGGQQATVRVCRGAYGGAAAATGTAYEPCVDGVVALAVDGPSVRLRWRGPSFHAGGPVLAGGSVWVPDLGRGDLVALDPATGQEQSRAHLGKLPHFATPGLADGLLVMGTLDGDVIALGS